MPPNRNNSKSSHLAEVIEGGTKDEPRWAFKIIPDYGDIRIVTATAEATVQADGLDIENGELCIVIVDNFEEEDVVTDVRVPPWKTRRDPEPVSVTEAAGKGAAGKGAAGEEAVGEEAAGEEGT